MLPGPFRRAAHVEQVVQHLEGDTHLAAVPRQGSDLLIAPSCRQAAEPAGGGEEARGLQLAAPQVALDR
jgi:hypothetical protein